MNGGHEPKISLPEALFVGQWLLLIDIIEMVPLLNFLGDFGITDAMAFPAEQIYLYLRSAPQLPALAGNIAELFPAVGWFPIRTLAFMATVFLDRTVSVAYGAAAVIGAGEGAVAAGETAVSIGGIARGRAALAGAAGETAAAERAAAGVGRATATGEEIAAGATGGEAVAGAGVATREAAAAAGEARGIVAGGEALAPGVPAGETAGKEISPEAFGVQKEPLEKVKEIMENLPEPRQSARAEDENNVTLNDESNEIDLRNAA